eukprot:PhF_6_TR19937/c0_g2_i2/m.29011
MWQQSYTTTNQGVGVDTLREEIHRVLNSIQSVESDIHRNPSSSPTTRNERRSMLESLKRQLADLRVRLAERQQQESSIGVTSQPQPQPQQTNLSSAATNSTPQQQVQHRTNSPSRVTRTPNHPSNPSNVDTYGAYYASPISLQQHQYLQPAAAAAAPPVPLQYTYNPIVTPNTANTAMYTTTTTTSVPPHGSVTALTTNPTHNTNNNVVIYGGGGVDNTTSGLAKGHLETLRSAMRNRHSTEKRLLREEYERQSEALEQRHRAEHEALTMKFDMEERSRQQYEMARSHLEAAKRELEETVMGVPQTTQSPRTFQQQQGVPTVTSFSHTMGSLAPGPITIPELQYKMKTY